MLKCNPTDVTNGFVCSPGHKDPVKTELCGMWGWVFFNLWGFHGTRNETAFLIMSLASAVSVDLRVNLISYLMRLHRKSLFKDLFLTACTQMGSLPESVIFSGKSNWQPNLLMHPCRGTNTAHTMVLSGNLQTSEDVSCQLLPASMMSFFKARYNPFLTSQGPSVSRCDPDWRSAEAEVFWKMWESIKAKLSSIKATPPPCV